MFSRLYGIRNVSAMFTRSVHKNRVTLRGASIVASRVASMPLETYEDSIEGKKKKKIFALLASWLLDWKQKCGKKRSHGRNFLFRFLFDL